MRKLFIAMVCVFALAGNVLAAEVSATRLDDGGFAWLDMDTNTTSAQEIIWKGGCLQFHLQGTYDGQLTVIHRPRAVKSDGTVIDTTAVNIDVDAVPDGLFYTSSTKAQVSLPSGWVDLRFDSAAGAASDYDIIANDFPWGCRK